MSYQKFETPGPVTVRVENKAGDVVFHATDAAVTEVQVSVSSSRGNDLADGTLIEHHGADGRHLVTVEVPWPGGLLKTLLRSTNEVVVTVHAPMGSMLEATTAAGDVTVHGRFGALNAQSASGDVNVDEIVHDVSVRTASGDVSIGTADGRATVETASGDVRCRVLGAGGKIKTASGDIDVGATRGVLEVSSASGDLSLGEVSDGCHLRAGTGDLHVSRLVAGRAQLDAVSGDLTVGVARGTLLAVDVQTVSGDLQSDIDLDGEGWDDGPAEGPKAEVIAHTVSGDVRIRRASP